MPTGELMIQMWLIWAGAPLIRAGGARRGTGRERVWAAELARSADVGDLRNLAALLIPMATLEMRSGRTGLRSGRAGLRNRPGHAGRTGRLKVRRLGPAVETGWGTKRPRVRQRNVPGQAAATVTRTDAVPSVACCAVTVTWPAFPGMDRMNAPPMPP